MKVIGLTGGICSGKSTVASILSDLGVQTIDADKLGHKAYEPGTTGYDKVVQCFGDGILDKTTNDPQPPIDRRLLGNIVFRDKCKMSALQDIVWPEIRRLLVDIIESHKGKSDIVAIEAAVMIEAGWFDLMDELWVVEVSREDAVRRLMIRNSLSAEDAESRLNSQLSNEERRRFASRVIVNDDDVPYLRDQCEKILHSLTR